ncbi:P-loop NTPase fold protein [Kribbella sp. NPDC006257]|uniref:P-loop NTPase fold protein n=1 Tax=Kribbella sp. NPDC006257 TaxID=3156738 RepID=UPI00339FEEA2
MSQAPSSPTAGPSPSFFEALQWAEASAALRGSGPVTEPDLFLGALLAHPDPDGEMYRLISHFGLKARDVLPDNFPQITAESLRRAAATVGTTVLSRGSDADVDVIISAAQQRITTLGPRPNLAHLVGALLTESPNFQAALRPALDRSGVSLNALIADYDAFLRNLRPDQEVAGRELGERLARRFPRRPASLAGFSSDVVDPSADFVDISNEADAFAYLISSRGLVPPLAVGLFGEWGSGKSFLMAKIRHRIEQLGVLAGSTADADLTIWPTIAHIQFNAWEYVETNLWASLLDKIFDELSPAARQKLSDRRRADTLAKLDAKEKDVAEAEHQVEALRAAETSAAATVRTEEKQVDEVVRTTARLRDSLIAGELEASAGAALVQTVVAVGKEKLGAEVTDAVADVRRAAVATRTSPWLHQRFWTGKRVAAVLLAAAVVPVVAFVMDWLSAPPLAGLLTSLAPLIPLAALAAKAAATFATGQQEALAQAERKVDEQLAKVVDTVKESLTAAGAQLDKTREDLAAKVQEVNEAREQQAELERERERLTVGNILVEFLEEREASDDYRSHLSLVSKVHQDLQDLADLTAEFNAENPRGAGGPPNRIVLYIDDLDRCPPAKVVEVLEAVHLLLSFPLFVVVVAVDTRWLTSALRAALPAFQVVQDASGSLPDAMDYVEKIFQIPFWVEPLDDDARRRLLRGLLLPSVAAETTGDGGAEGGTLSVGKREEELVKTMLTGYGAGLDLDARQLLLTADELAFIESLAPLIGGTPRQVKRFVNICQLLLAMAPPLSADVDDPTERDRPSERMATCFMAALHEGLPALAKRLALSEALTLREAITGLDPDIPKGSLESWLITRRQSAHPGAATFDGTPLSMFSARFDLIRRLTFKVGIS